MHVTIRDAPCAPCALCRVRAPNPLPSPASSMPGTESSRWDAVSSSKRLQHAATSRTATNCCCCFRHLHRFSNQTGCATPVPSCMPTAATQLCWHGQQEANLSAKLIPAAASVQMHLHCHKCCMPLGTKQQLQQLACKRPSLQHSRVHSPRGPKALNPCITAIASSDSSCSSSNRTRRRDNSNPSSSSGSGSIICCLMQSCWSNSCRPAGVQTSCWV